MKKSNKLVTEGLLNISRLSNGNTCRAGQDEDILLLRERN